MERLHSHRSFALHSSLYSASYFFHQFFFETPNHRGKTLEKPSPSLSGQHGTRYQGWAPFSDAWVVQFLGLEISMVCSVGDSCWWFRNPKANHLGWCKKPVVNNGMSTTVPSTG